MAVGSVSTDDVLCSGCTTSGCGGGVELAVGGSTAISSSFEEGDAGFGGRCGGSGSGCGAGAIGGIGVGCIGCAAGASALGLTEYPSTPAIIPTSTKITVTLIPAAELSPVSR